jgi:hypothetical protein
MPHPLSGGFPGTSYTMIPMPDAQTVKNKRIADAKAFEASLKEAVWSGDSKSLNPTDLTQDTLRHIAALLQELR